VRPSAREKRRQLEDMGSILFEILEGTNEASIVSVK